MKQNQGSVPAGRKPPPVAVAEPLPPVAARRQMADRSTAARPRSHSPLPDEVLSLIAERFKVLSEPLRLRLLQELEGGERTVGELVAATGKTQTNVSRHLRSLADAGILARHKEGVSVFYRIADPMIFELCRQVCGSLRRAFERQGKVSELLRM